MLISWIKQFLRVSERGKFYTIVNILGLAFGLTCTMLILLWSDFQMSYDKFHKDYKRIFQVYEIQSYANGYKLYTYATPGPLAAFLREKFPDVESSARYNSTSAVIGIGDKAFREKYLGFTDSTFFDVFTLDFISGDPKTCLKDKGSIVLSEELAQKIFRSIDVVGKSVRINGVLEFNVTAVVKDYPKNSNIKFTGLIPFTNLSSFGWGGIENWGWNSHSTFVKVFAPEKIKELEEKISKEKKTVLSSETTNFYFNPIERVRLYDPDPNELSFIFLVAILVSVAGFVLLIACINFINLITARAANRAKEVGVRKVIGSSRAQLISQYFMESFLNTIVALLVAILLVDLVLPVFNQIVEVDLHMSFLDFNFWKKIIIVILGVGFISGIYPALVLSSFQPAAVLKGSLRSGAKSAGFRKTMVIIQFTLTIFLVILTFFMFKHLNYVNTKDTGMSRKNIVSIPFRKEMDKNYKSFKVELKKIPSIKYVTAAGDMPFRIGSSTSSISWSGIDTTQSYLFTYLYADEYLTDALEIPMLEGRYYSSDFPSDTACIVLNEAAAKVINKAPIIGEIITVWNEPKKVIGVMKDFNYNHFSGKIKPLYIWYAQEGLSVVIIKADSPYSDITMNQIKAVFNDFYPEYPFESTLLDDDYHKMFSIEKQIRSIFGYFAVIAIIISCMGLLSLAAYIAEQQRKSLVLRKIHGASMVRILIMLLGSFTIWVLISGVIAIPLSYFALKQMFSNYAYHAEFSWWVFAGALGFALFIAFFTVLYQALKTARVNPVDILRYE
ncbi:MAG: ABC transporter permease [Tenuifilaceae bacterium]